MSCDKVTLQVCDSDMAPRISTPFPYPLLVAPTSLSLRIGARSLLHLYVRDGVLHASYDPADLDEAAQLFVKHVLSMAAEGAVQIRLAIGNA